MSVGESALTPSVARPPARQDRRRHEIDAEPGGPGSRAPEIFERDHEGIRVLGVAGDLDLGAAVAFCARLDAVRAAGSSRLVLDLTQLDFCDSSSLRALIGAADEVVASAGCVALVAPIEGPAARLFALTGAEESLPLYPTVTEALAALGSGV